MLLIFKFSIITGSNLPELNPENVNEMDFNITQVEKEIPQEAGDDIRLLDANELHLDRDLSVYDKIDGNYGSSTDEEDNSQESEDDVGSNSGYKSLDAPVAYDGYDQFFEDDQSVITYIQALDGMEESRMPYFGGSDENLMQSVEHSEPPGNRDIMEPDVDSDEKGKESKETIPVPVVIPRIPPLDKG